MTVIHLSEISFDALMDCFLAAFGDYFVQMPQDKNYYRDRWKASKVDYEYSYGMVDQGRLVGFIINGIDKRRGVFTAFNTGTGVIPEYRGRKIVKSVYDSALKDLHAKGVAKCTLEVITDNPIAIRSYKSIGFKICKTYKCFSGTISTGQIAQMDIEQVPLDNVDWDLLPNQEYYSWDFQKETLLGTSYLYYQVLLDKTPESFFIINPKTHYLAQFDVLNANNASWQRLFSAIGQVASSIKVNNVDQRLKDKLHYLRLLGLENTIDQYEMELIIEDHL